MTAYCVLDLETAVSTCAASLAGGSTRPDVGRAALHELLGGSLLTFDRGGGGTFGAFRHVRVGESGEGEAAMLRSLDDELRPAHDAQAVLVTFNGAHDLSVLARRAGRHWLFGRCAYANWPAAGGDRHLDLMRLDPASTTGRWPSLVDAAAGYGFAATCARPTAASATVVPSVRKAEVDTCATALLLFHHLAHQEGSVRPLVEGWAALSRWLISRRDREDHLRHFARHPSAAAARKVVQA